MLLGVWLVADTDKVSINRSKEYDSLAIFLFLDELNGALTALDGVVGSAAF